MNTILRRKSLVAKVLDVVKEHNILMPDAMEYVLAELEIEHDMYWEHDRLVQAFCVKKDINIMNEIIKEFK